MKNTRVRLESDPFLPRYRDASFTEFGKWPASWIGCADAATPPFVTAYRRRFTAETAATVRVHVSADERYELFLDGERIGRGPERGDAGNWFFESYDLDLTAGEHVLVARVWSLGAQAPVAQTSVHPGFLLAAEDEAWRTQISTGVAPWEAKVLDGYTWNRDVPPYFYFAFGACADVDGARFPWGFERGEGDGWRAAKVLFPAFGAIYSAEIPPRILQPAMLPAMLEESKRLGRVRHVAPIAADAVTKEIAILEAAHQADEAAAWQRLLAAGEAVTLPARTTRRVLLDLDDYYCAYPEITVSGGAGGMMRLHWAESLYHEPQARTKGNRGVIEGKYFVGVGDTFRPDGGANRRFETLWWRCGRYVELLLQTGDEPLTIENLLFRETRYPLALETAFDSSDERLQTIIPLAVRAMQMCAHETYMDCPYYEQLMYVGDTRLEILTTYAMTLDSQLPRKALRMFDASRLSSGPASGLTQSRYPASGLQVIPPFSLWWVAMLHDYALWRDDHAFVAAMMPGARGVLDAFRGYLNADGLVENPHGWNFMDWVPGWDAGIPPQGKNGVSGIINWQFVLVLGLAARLEWHLGEEARAGMWRDEAAALAARLQKYFWSEKRGLFADDLAHEKYSEHAQCLAILSGQLNEEMQRRAAQGLFEADDLARTTIYFTHYLFETHRLLGRSDAFFERMGLWFALRELDFKTTVESPEPSRSDCHAWGAHPLYHYFASILGIRPAAMGFAAVEIAPQLGRLTHASGRLLHPKGAIEAELRVENQALRGRLVLPPGLGGRLVYGGATQELHAGAQGIELRE